MVKVYIGKDSKGIDGLKLSEFDHLLIEWSVYDENFNIVKYLQNIRGRNTKQGGKQKMNEIIRKADTDLLWALLSDVTAIIDLRKYKPDTSDKVFMFFGMNCIKQLIRR